MRLLPLVLLALPIALGAQAKPSKPPAPKDTLTAAERAQLREATRDASSIARRNLSDSTARRLRAEAAAPTAFADAEARAILDKARVARLAQDGALKAYRATTTQRISVGMGVRRVGLEKLLFRSDNVANIAWKEGVGVRVTPIGSRMTVPMASKVQGDMVEAVTIPYFPGRESLWFPSSNLGVMKTDIDEREMIHPLARGAETYYRYATGDSANIKLPDGRLIRLRELRITARKPQWRLVVGSFWFDRDGGQLVRAAYRLSVDIDIWDLVSEESGADAAENVESMRVRDSIARARLPRELYVKDSTLRAEREAMRSPESRKRRASGEEDDVPLMVKSLMRPAKAKLDGISVEYGLYQGRFWLPRAHSASASAQMGFVRTPLQFDEKFTYEEVNGDFSLAPLPPVTPLTRTVDPVTGISSDSTDNVTVGGSKTIVVSTGGGADDTTALARAKRDSVVRRRNPARARQCDKDSVWTKVESRFEGALRVAYDMPCEEGKLAKSAVLPPAYTSDEEMFDIKSRDELLSALDLSLQPSFAPGPIKLRSGADLARYNRIEGFSLGVTATSELGAGYTAAALARIGHADLHANGELSLTRSNGRRAVTGSVYHRLDAANPEWGGALTLGPSLPALLYARDEGFYYRSFGAELRETREFRGGSLDYRLFVERQWTAGDTDVVNTFNIARLIDNRRFRRNVVADPVAVTGVAASLSRAFGGDPMGLRLVTTTRAEAGTGSFGYGRLSAEGTASRPIGRFAAALTGALGSSAGRVPIQRLWYMGGLRTVRGQVAGTQAGNAFWLARAEIGTAFRAVRPVAFFDVGWAGSRKEIGATQPQRGAGVGLGLLDGLLRVDVSRGIYPGRRWRTDFYLGAPL